MPVKFCCCFFTWLVLIVFVLSETLHPESLQDERNGDRHVLIFHIPQTNRDELFLGAELKILTIIEINSETILGMSPHKPILL